MVNNYIRPRYIDFLDFDTKDLSSFKTVFKAHSTNKRRTKDNAKEIVSCMFENIPRTEIESSIHIKELKDDHLLHLDAGNCEVHRKIFLHAKRS